MIYVYYIFGDCKIYYRIHGKIGDGMNVFLHGWGQNGDCFNDVIRKVGGSWLTIDFPPFGKSEEPKDWTIFSYVNMAISLCEKLNICSCNLVGHSFGGRIAILIASLRPNMVNKLMLVDSAGMKPKRKISYYINILLYKMLKMFGYLSKKSGSNDYCKLSDNMKSTFISVVNTNLEEYCPQIKAETAIVFGENDVETPIYMAKRLRKLIKNSKLYLIEGAGHFVFIDRSIAFIDILKNFLGESE